MIQKNEVESEVINVDNIKFARTYKLVIGKDQSKAVIIQPPFNIKFNVKKDDNKDNNESDITVYNLSKSTIDRFVRADYKVTLYAGYLHDGGDILISTGTIVYIEIGTEEGNGYVRVVYKDGFKEFRDSFISVAYKVGTPIKKILEDLAKNTSLPVVFAKDIEFKNLSSAFSFSGASRVAIKKICNENDLSFSIQNGILQIIKRGGTNSKMAFIINPKTGLLGSPARKLKSANSPRVNSESDKGKKVTEKKGDSSKNQYAPKDEANQERQGISIKTLLIPTVNPSDIVKLESTQYNDFFKVLSVTHTGDYQGDSWESELTLQILEAKEQNKTNVRK